MGRVAFVAGREGRNNCLGRGVSMGTRDTNGVSAGPGGPISVQPLISEMMQRHLVYLCSL